MSEFVIVRPQIVGTADAHELVCLSDCVPYHSVNLAYYAGLRKLEHDDFWIAEVDEAHLIDIRHSSGEVRDGATDGERVAVARALAVFPGLGHSRRAR